jgi:hypothetical protein
LRRTAEREMRSSLTRLRPEEAAVVALLQQRLKMSETDLLRQKLRESVRLKTKGNAARTQTLNGSRP